MSKALRQSALLLFLFFGFWFLLGRIHFVNILQVEKLTRENERRLGRFIVDAACSGHAEIDTGIVSSSTDSLKSRLCGANGIADSSIKIHVLVSDEINAYALPDGHIIVYTGLLEFSRTPGEVGGVLAHEIGHIRKHHVMKKLTKEIGLTMLTTMAGGQSGAEIGRETVRLLSSSAFDREQESEADAAAVEMTAAAGIDPRELANFLFRLSHERKGTPRQLAWLSTHPDSQERTAEIIRLRNLSSLQSRPMLDSTSWAAVRLSARRFSSNSATRTLQ